MPQILIRRLDQHVICKLRAKAAADGVSAEEEARRILRRSLVGEAPGMSVDRVHSHHARGRRRSDFSTTEAQAAQGEIVNGFLLDTNVVSELRKRERCAAKVSARASTVAPNQDFLSVLVVGELRRGAILKRRSDWAAADALERWITRLVQLYSDRILAITLEIAYEWGRLSALRPIPPEDGLLAATALVHRLTFATRNTKNVEGLGISLVNPWM